MRDIRLKEREIIDKNEIDRILLTTKVITIAMAVKDQPYLVTVDHIYFPAEKTIYFHCAKKGKKIDILKQNNKVWGQALLDKGYVQGECSHAYESVHFLGECYFVEDLAEKEKALKKMIWKLDANPEQVYSKQISEKSLRNVGIVRIDIKYLSAKRSLYS